MLRIFLYILVKKDTIRLLRNQQNPVFPELALNSFVLQPKHLLNTIKPLTAPHRPLALNSAMYYYS